jgi:peptide/nickel transport system substrate-binding protein
MRRTRVPIGRPAIAAGVLAVTALAAAVPAATGAVDREAAPTAKAAGGTLVIDRSFDLKTLDPQRQYEITGGIIDHAIYDSLLTFKGSDVTHPLPSVAASFKASADAKTYTFQLRKNVKFSDGTPLTSADVVFSYRRLINLKGNPSFLLAGITPTAKGKYTVVLKSKTANPAIPVLVANTSLGIVNSKVVKAHGGTDAVGADKKDKAESYLNKTSAGSGPYVLKTMNVSSQVTLAANTAYWGAKKPAFPNVVIRNTLAAAQLLNVQRGSNEIALDLSPDQASGLKGKGNLQVLETPSPNMIFLLANHSSKVSTTTSNAHFQNAIRYGIDYNGMVKLAGSGAAQAVGVIPSMFLGALPASSAVKYDLAKAKAELQASGISSPKVKLEYPSDLSVNGLSFGVMAQRIKSDLDKVGIDAELTGAPIATSLANYRAGTEELGLWYWGPDYPDPNDYQAFLPGQLVGLRAGWVAGDDPTIEALAKKAAQTVKPAARGALYRQIGNRLNKVGPFFPLLQPGQVVAASKNLTNVTFNPLYWTDIAAVGTR